TFEMSRNRPTSSTCSTLTRVVPNATNREINTRFIKIDLAVPSLGSSHMLSISDEMPGPWRHRRHADLKGALRDFNLRRDARPLATVLFSVLLARQGEFQSQTRCQAPGDLTTEGPTGSMVQPFNLRRDARPLATQAARPV